MKAETPEQKYNRLQAEIQNIVLNAYPNPERVGCPGPRTIENYAKRSAASRGRPEEDADYEHIMHCSPCYRAYLDAREALRAMSSDAPAPVPRHVEKRLSRMVDQLEKGMQAAREKAARRAALRRMHGR